MRKLEQIYIIESYIFIASFHQPISREFSNADKKTDLQA
jgi:hypothetical protein